MNLLGIAIRRPSSKDFFIAGLVSLICICAMTGVYALTDVELSRETFVVMLSAFLAGSLSNACGVRVVDHGWRAMMIIMVFGVVLWGILTTAFL